MIEDIRCFGLVGLLPLQLIIEGVDDEKLDVVASSFS